MKGIPLKMYLYGRVCSHYLPANVAACDITVTHILRFFTAVKMTMHMRKSDMFFVLLKT